MRILNKIYESPILVVLTAVLLRLLPHEPNVAPIGALALFGGAYLPKKQAAVVPMLAMLVSDFFLGFHSTMIWVYGSFLLIVGLGLWLRSNLNWRSVLLASAVSSILFYLITNFGVWFSGSLYPKTLNGLWESYFMGLPFFRNTLVGDFGYNLIFFGGYALMVSASRKLNWAQKSS